jgi:murein L,D-transpeptidase YafK
MRTANRLLATLAGLVLPLAMSTSMAADPIPSSPRSLAAMARVAPELMSAVKTAGFTWGAPLYLRVFKKERSLEVWIEAGSHYRLFRDYAICDYSGGLGPKIEEGDNQSPEGFYNVDPEQLNPESQYHLSFDLGFPNAYDLAQGRTGEALMVHGDCISVGCFAMATGMAPGDEARNRPIEEIWTLMVAAFQRGHYRSTSFPSVWRRRSSCATATPLISTSGGTCGRATSSSSATAARPRSA